MAHPPEPIPDQRPRVVFFDPIGWVQDWSYAEEIEALAPLGVDVVIPENRHARDRYLPDADVVVVSSIGRAVAARARAFGMFTVATYRRPEVAETELPHVPLERLLADSNALVLTASLNPSTAGIIDAGAPAAASPGLVLVNVARGGLIVERDLAQALDDGIVAVAALDGTPNHPIPPRTCSAAVPT